MASIGEVTKVRPYTIKGMVISLNTIGLMRFDVHWLAARGEGPSTTCAGPAPAVPPLVAGEPRGGRKCRLPLEGP